MIKRNWSLTKKQRILTYIYDRSMLNSKISSSYPKWKHQLKMMDNFILIRIILFYFSSQNTTNRNHQVLMKIQCQILRMIFFIHVYFVFFLHFFCYCDVNLTSISSINMTIALDIIVIVGFVILPLIRFQILFFKKIKFSML